MAQAEVAEASGHLLGSVYPVAHLPRHAWQRPTLAHGRRGGDQGSHFEIILSLDFL